MRRKIKITPEYRAAGLAVYYCYQCFTASFQVIGGSIAKLQMINHCAVSQPYIHCWLIHRRMKETYINRIL